MQKAQCFTRSLFAVERGPLCGKTGQEPLSEVGLESGMFLFDYRPTEHTRATVERNFRGNLATLMSGRFGGFQ